MNPPVRMDALGEALQTALSLYARAEAAERERDALWAEALGMRGALAETYAQWAGLRYTHPHLVPSIITSPIEQALSAPLTTAAVERVKAMERVCEVAKEVCLFEGNQCLGDLDTELGVAIGELETALASLGKEGE